MTEIAIKRVREQPGPDDGRRILVDRLWPRGVSKDKAALDGHAKEIAPSTDLRTWFGHDPRKWDEFTDRYRAELDENPAAARFAEQIREVPKLTLLYDAKDTEHNHAIVLREWLQQHL